MLLAWILACGGNGEDETASQGGEGGGGGAGSGDDSGSGAGDDSGADSADSGGGGGDDTGQPFNGTAPAEALPAPEFEVQNHLGETRTRDALIGHPTVLWFYPLAGTSG